MATMMYNAHASLHGSLSDPLPRPRQDHKENLGSRSDFLFLSISIGQAKLSIEAFNLSNLSGRVPISFQGAILSFTLLSLCFPNPYHALIVCLCLSLPLQTVHRIFQLSTSAIIITS